MLYNRFSAGTLKCSIREMKVVSILIRLLHNFSHPVKNCKIVCAETFPTHTEKKTLCSENDYLLSKPWPFWAVSIKCSGALPPSPVWKKRKAIYVCQRAGQQPGDRTWCEPRARSCILIRNLCSTMELYRKCMRKCKENFFSLSNL